MRWRAIAAVSLIVNAVIAAIFFLSWQPGKSRSLASSAQAALNLPARTNVVIRRQFFEASATATRADGLQLTSLFGNLAMAVMYAIIPAAVAVAASIGPKVKPS